jgi:anti-sigma factor RsiW
MNRDEAKLILQAYRPGGRDAGDPYFAEALAFVQRDAELAAWFAEQQRFDSSISGAFQQVHVPSRLKSEILASDKKEESPAAAWWQNLFSWQSPIAWSAAVLVIVVLSFALFRTKPEGPARFADYSAQMVNTAMNDKHHVDIDVNNLKQAVAWFSDHHGENGVALPATFNGDDGLMGCRVLDWHGQKVSMLCYAIKGMMHVDVFVAEANIFPDAPPANNPQFVVSDGFPTASWSHDGKVYLAVSHGNDAILKELLSSEKLTLLMRKFSVTYRF